MNPLSSIICLDNQDSFTYNLVDELAQLGPQLEVYRNTVSTQVILQRLAECASQGPVLLCLSPGPGHPQDAGCLQELVRAAAGRYPILGICLGFQALVEHLGGQVDRCHEVVHGKTSALEFNADHPIFAQLGTHLPVARYHSLQAVRMPPQVTELARLSTPGGLIPMAFIEPEQRLAGFQFHPESIMTTAGSALLAQTVNYLMHENEEAQCNN